MSPSVTQMMDMICVRVQDHLNSLRFTETSAVQEDVKAAENFMKDARNSKKVGGRVGRSREIKIPPFLFCH